MSGIGSRRLIGAASVLVALPWTCREARAADEVFYGKYSVSKIELLADGQWRPATKTAPGQFLFIYKPAWPKQMHARVHWSIPPAGPGDPRGDPCQSRGAPKYIVVKLDGVAQPGQVVAPVTQFGFSYPFQNLSRTASHTFSAQCEFRLDFNTVYRSSGGATLTYQADALMGWKPGLERGGPDWIQIQQPSEGQVLSRTLPLQVRVVSTKELSDLPKKLGLEVEKGLDAQTGVVGDIALPGNKAYGHQWKPAKTFWKDSVYWDHSAEAHYRQKTSLTLPGYLGQGRIPEHEPGIYRMRLLLPDGGSPSPWRSFQIPGKPVLQKVR